LTEGFIPQRRGDITKRNDSALHKKRIPFFYSLTIIPSKASPMKSVDAIYSILFLEQNNTCKKGKVLQKRH